jgi:Domain of unknown function (DUF5615)
LRLCLDEHYSKAIAGSLRERGHNVDCATERPELVSAADADLWARMQEERRTLLTEDVADFMPLVTSHVEAGESHWGIVFSNPRSMPRGPGTIGLFVERLDALMKQHESDDAFRDRVEWLVP